MVFNHVSNYSVLLDEIIKREELYHPHLGTERIIVEIIGIEIYWYRKLLRENFPDFNNPAVQKIKLYLECNYNLSRAHCHKKILIIILPEKSDLPDEPSKNRYKFLILKGLNNGNFEDLPLSKKARNEIRRWPD